MQKPRNIYETAASLASSDNLNFRLIGWTGRWSILGSFLVCNQCLATQTMDYADQPFQHMGVCSDYDKPAHNPWWELTDILNRRFAAQR